MTFFPVPNLRSLISVLVEQPSKKPGRPRKHATNRGRVAGQRQKAKEKKLQLLADQFRLRAQDTTERNWGKEEDGWSCAENTIELYSGLGTQPLTATFYSSIFSPIPLAYASGNIDAFVEFLYVCHEHQAKSKEDLYLFSPAIFDPNRSTGKNRGKDNILYLRHIVLDFENGELRPETLPKLFPDLQMVVTNTFNHTSDKPRFRAVFFTSEIMTPEVYSLIYNFIADKLQEAGYSVERPSKHLKTSSESNSRPSGLDWSKSLPTSLFYFPCQARCTDDSFFMECMEGRYPLNPSTWIENTTVPLQPTFESFEPDIQVSRVDEKMVQSAISTWRTSPSYPRRGNVMFFDLAFSLKYAGLAFPEIERTLHAEAHHARSPQKRLAQIPSIMASLRVYSELWRDRTLAIEVPAA